MSAIWTVLDGLNFEPTVFFCEIALFLALHFVLNWLIYQPIIEVRNRRDAKISLGLAAAQEATEAAQKLKVEYDEGLRLARLEGQTAMARAVEESEAACKVRVDRAKAEAARVLDEARSEAESARAKAEAALGVEVEAVAKSLISQLISSSLGAKESAPILAKIRGKK